MNCKNFKWHYFVTLTVRTQQSILLGDTGSIWVVCDSNTVVSITFFLVICRSCKRQYTDGCRAWDLMWSRFWTETRGEKRGGSVRWKYGHQSSQEECLGWNWCHRWLWANMTEVEIVVDNNNRVSSVRDRISRERRMKSSVKNEK